VKGPKSSASKRTVAIPAPLLPARREHVDRYAQTGAQGLLYPASDGGWLTQVTFRAALYRAQAAAGRPDLRFHDLRHTGATLAAATGATLAELMARLGHSTLHAAMIYQHASADRDRVIADALGDMIGGNVEPLVRPA
jgi:integrase